MIKSGVMLRFVGNVLNKSYSFGENIYWWAQGYYKCHQTPPTPRRPMQIILLVSLICVLVIGCRVLPSQRFRTHWYLFSSKTIPSFEDRQLSPSLTIRELTDEELHSRAIVNGILAMPYVRTPISKIAFMFMTPGSLPFEKLWEKFFLGHESMFSIYVHASKKHPIHTSKLFVGRDIHSSQVEWGDISMVEAERRLLANAFQDPNNQHFVLLSESCVPIHNFEYVYRYLMDTKISFVDCFEDLGIYGSGRYSMKMMPEVEKTDFRKGSQWFSIQRRHAFIILSDYIYHKKFSFYCKPKMDGGINCYADEHYIPTFLHMIDPTGIANWSVTYVNWSERKWHPKEHGAKDVNLEFLKNITSIDESVHFRSDEKNVSQTRCIWNGIRRPCYLFARKFNPRALQNLIDLFPQLNRLE